jgi:myo-inositol 2-dehydrogenase / D-chiro-inositol 1-dehydrogenase
VTVNVGVIGVGMIGKDHIRRLTTVLAGSKVVAVTDVNLDEAKRVADGVPGAAAYSTGQELIKSDDVDAIIVCSWGPTHEEYVLAAIEAGKPVFCEKPLATTQEACRRIIDAEVAFGRRLVQVGYMRRYDKAYRALKAVLDSGEIGAPLMMHCTHRNPSVPGHYTKDMAITDTAVHEIDMVRWIFGEEIVGATVLTPRKSKNGGELQDPLFLLLEMASGGLIDVEISVNIRYGYDIRGEVVGEEGTVALGESSSIVVRKNNQYSGRVPEDWRERFIQAYDVEFQEWIDGVRDGGTYGPSSWDGYAAAVVSDAAVESIKTGIRTAVQLGERPALYA